MTSPEAVFESLYGADDPDTLGAALETPDEGQEMQVPCKGSVVNVLNRIRGHLQSAISYAGKNAKNAARRKIVPDPRNYFIPLPEASWRESYQR